MATVVLTDGSAITATDHHRFYEAGAGAYVEAEDLTPGDVLVTPEGARGPALHRRFEVLSGASRTRSTGQRVLRGPLE